MTKASRAVKQIKRKSKKLSDETVKLIEERQKLFEGDLPMALKHKLMVICSLPVLTYGAQTWSFTNTQKSKLKVYQRAMERSRAQYSVILITVPN